jgi:multiple antibiotic resistance protein
MPSFAALGSFAAVPSAFLLAFSALFSIVNPLGGAIIFSQITAARTHAERLKLASRVGLYSLVLLLVSLWAGSYVLNFFGITLGALRVAGGLVVAVRGWRLLENPELREAEKHDQAHQDGRTVAAADVADIAFFPITIPFTVGPGSISVAITLGASRPLAGGDLPYLLGCSAAALAISITVWVLYGYADAIARMLGQSGSRIVTRLVALILLAIGVQIMASGVTDLLAPLVHSVKS